jgi:MtaA/CmuA family methyltransferase
MNRKDMLFRLVRTGESENRALFHPILMHFAARFSGHTYSEFASDYRVLSESAAACAEHFDLDAVMLLSDPYRETSAFGAKIEFPSDAVPICREHIVRTVEDIERLPDPDVYSAERTRDRIRAAEYCRKIIGDALPVIGWVEGPLAEACDLAGVNEVLLALALDPGFVRRLMEKCLVAAKEFARAQISAGCQVMGVGDAICSQISPEMYENHVLPLHHELFDSIRSQGALVKLHICGNITHLLPHLRTAGADIIDLDWMVDPARAHSTLGEGTIVCGNLNPVSVIRELPAEEVYRSSRALVEKERGRRFILSGGCEITADTPHENLFAMRRAADMS